MPAALAVVISVLVGVVAGLTLTPTALGASPTTRSGVYCSTSDPACVNAFAAWRGKPVDAVLTFLSSSNWAGIEAPDSWLIPWTTNPYKDDVVITVPLLPSSGDAADSTPTMAEGAAGDYDSHFVTLANRLVGAGLGNSVIRLGHEFNGTWYAWSAKPSPSNFIAYWQHAVTAMRSVPGANFKFDWNVNNAMVVWDARTAYPGDAYVDTIGEDVYDFHWGSTGQTPQQRWAYIVEPGGTYSEGLRWWADFAASRGKPLS